MTAGWFGVWEFPTLRCRAVKKAPPIVRFGGTERETTHECRPGRTVCRERTHEPHTAPHARGDADRIAPLQYDRTQASGDWRHDRVWQEYTWAKATRRVAADGIARAGGRCRDRPHQADLERVAKTHRSAADASSSVQVSSCAGSSDAERRRRCWRARTAGVRQAPRHENRGGEAAAMVAQLYGDLRPVGRAVASSCHGVSGGAADAG
jgi:hypothetical protein